MAHPPLHEGLHPVSIDTVDQLIVDFIQQFTAQRGYAPTVREIGVASNLRSTSTVHGRLAKLRDLGIVDYENVRARTVRVVQPCG